MDSVDVLVVGAGFAGAVCARALADAGRRVRVIERRDHIGGSAHDRLDAHGVLIHPYGPHIFRTNAERIVAFLGRFTGWRPYEHRVLAVVDGQHYPMPINRTTLERVTGRALDEEAARRFLESERVPIEHPRTSEDAVLSSVGHRLCDLFFRGYTRKQWGLDLSQLDASVVARVATRTSDDDRYFTDRFQCMPAEGYTAMFERMLAHPLIELRLNTPFEAVRGAAAHRHLVYTGPIDAYYGHRHGRLPYRSLRFEHEHRADVDRVQPVGTLNYPNEHAYTRCTEFKHLTGQQCRGTSLMREYPLAEGDPYYPIPRPENHALYRRYADEADAEPAVTFVGRLAQYRYYSMDQVVGAALAAAERVQAALAR